MYTFDSTVRYSEIDYTHKLNIKGILDYFQDCSTLQSEGLGVGLDSLHDKNLVWVLSTWQIDVIRYPLLGERIVIGTFPYEFRGFFGRRNFIMKTKEGEVLAMGDSMWTLLNYKEFKPARVTDEIRNTYELEEKLDMDYQKGKIVVPENSKKHEDIVVKNHHLDANMHVNNGEYVEMLLDEVSGQEFKRLRVEYRKQAKLGEILMPYIYEDNEKILAVFKDSDGNQSTVMELVK